MHTPHLEILEDLFFIERGYLNANHFVYRGDPPILIDTGYIADFDTTRRIINDFGLDLPEVSAIVTTHCHCDHIGGNNRIQLLSGCDILQHDIGRIFIETRDDWATWWKYYHQQAEFFTPTHGLKDGDTIYVGPHRFEVIYTPGHAADGIVLYQREEKILISSDTLWEHDLAVHTVRVEGSAAAYYTQKSLERLAPLEPALVCPGHGAAFSDFQGALGRSMERIEGYVTDRLKIGRDVLKKIIIYTLMMKKTVAVDHFFEQLMETNWFKETIDLYFNSDYRDHYNQIMEGFLKKGVVQRKKDIFFTTVKP